MCRSTWQYRKRLHCSIVFQLEARKKQREHRSLDHLEHRKLEHKPKHSCASRTDPSKIRSPTGCRVTCHRLKLEYSSLQERHKLVHRQEQHKLEHNRYRFRKQQERHKLVPKLVHKQQLGQHKLEHSCQHQHQHSWQQEQHIQEHSCYLNRRVPQERHKREHNRFLNHKQQQERHNHCHCSRKHCRCDHRHLDHMSHSMVA